MASEGYFVVTNASGRAINILNDDAESPSSPLTPDISDESVQPIITFPLSKDYNVKRKYHCTEPGCTKSFTTSGHLARHNRIHTGEKNFPCLFPGCSSRFSRQDNMMQHYRTHMSTKSKRTIKKVQVEDPYPRPRLHAHQRIKSDPYRVERPLTIDQHLNNYRKQLNISSTSSSTATINTDKICALEKPPLLLPPLQQQQLLQQRQQREHPHLPQLVKKSPLFVVTNQPSPPSPPPIAYKRLSRPQTAYTPTLSNSTPTSKRSTPPSPSFSTSSSTTSANTFYQYKPLVFSAGMENPVLPFSLLHPTFESPFISASTTASTTTVSSPISLVESPVTELSSSESSSSQSGLLQLANIISTFG